jgi:hypothetical protein
MKPMMTGRWIGVLFTYEDGRQSGHGRWKVPHDSQYQLLNDLAESMGHVILYEMAKQPWMTVVKCEVLLMEDMPDVERTWTQDDDPDATPPSDRNSDGDPDA